MVEESGGPLTLTGAQLKHLIRDYAKDCVRDELSEIL